ncbi:hypothetical protein Q428_00780 [Fervidicella metallireducens AeB]|uniref:Uncharacterized protein n=1 Tax=Fervidicella metallireducens AeB TaxID=1403537 RepID=A0A017S139_9CLOT|nr:hypothetical protein [Fervidicella metallireducens]EYE89890.1 hypothetical protein Q428_00780 [Fervidicella metallireducens AeB]
MDNILIQNLTEEIKLLREELHCIRSYLGVDNHNLINSKKFHNTAKNEESLVTFVPKDEENNDAIKYLLSKKINIKSYKVETEDDIFFKLSNYLGNRYPHLKDLYNTIKPSLSTGGSFYYNMQNKPQEVIAYATQFCNLLHQNAFLTNYSYKKSSKIIIGTPQRIGKVINFFTGGWLENYILHFLLQLLKTKEINNFSFVQNCQIELPNGDDFEIDMLFVINDSPIWIECKTGDYQRYISKYADFRKKLGTSADKSILLVSDLPEGISKNLTSTFQIKVCDLNEGKMYIEDLVDKL